MNVNDLIPWSRNRSGLSLQDSQDPFHLLRRDMNRLVEDFWSGFEAFPRRRGAAATWPMVELHDKGEAFQVTIELAGMEQKDIETLLDDDMLVIKGERQQEHQGALINERYFGHFERRIRLPAVVDPERIKAHINNGLLIVDLPKSAETKKKIIRIDIS